MEKLKAKQKSQVVLLQHRAVPFFFLNLLFVLQDQKVAELQVWEESVPMLRSMLEEAMEHKAQLVLRVLQEHLVKMERRAQLETMEHKAQLETMEHKAHKEPLETMERRAHKEHLETMERKVRRVPLEIMEHLDYQV